MVSLTEIKAKNEAVTRGNFFIINQGITSHEERVKVAVKNGDPEIIVTKIVPDQELNTLEGHLSEKVLQHLEQEVFLYPNQLIVDVEQQKKLQKFIKNRDKRGLRSVGMLVGLQSGKRDAAVIIGYDDYYQSYVFAEIRNIGIIDDDGKLKKQGGHTLWEALKLDPKKADGFSLIESQGRITVIEHQQQSL